MIPLPGAAAPSGSSDIPDVDTSVSDNDQNFAGDPPLDGSGLVKSRPSGTLLWGLGAAALLFYFMRK